MTDTGMADIRVELNGRVIDAAVVVGETLLEFLRDRGLTSVRGTCGVGVCGTCTVAVDGQVASSCLMLTTSIDGRRVTTSEGLVVDGELSELQQAFADCGAYQCSFCVPAMALTAQTYLDAHPDATASEVRDQLAGNLCRCGTYPQIMEAVARCVRR